MTDSRQVKPTTEGWQQKKDASGRPLLEFEAKPRRQTPPVHLVDMDKDERAAKAKELGVPAFRVKQIEKHYFTHYTSNPDDMTDLPQEGRSELVKVLSFALSVASNEKTSVVLLYLYSPRTVFPLMRLTPFDVTSI